MTLFGVTLDGAQIMSLISLLLVLVFWIMVLKRERRSARHINDLAARNSQNQPPPPAQDKNPDPAKGPWG